MSLYWRKASTKSDTELPQTIMQPFWHPAEVFLDNKQFCTPFSNNNSYTITIIVLIFSLTLFLVSFFFISTLFNELQATKTLDTQATTSLFSFFATFLPASLLLILLFQLVKPRTLSFNRENHSIKYPKRNSLLKYFEEDYDKFKGKIRYLRSPFGKRKAILFLEHIENNHSILLCSTLQNPRNLLGYWSFLVQYMKKNAPLPDVPELHNYPNKTAGIIQQKTIDFS